MACPAQPSASPRRRGTLDEGPGREATFRARHAASGDVSVSKYTLNDLERAKSDLRGSQDRFDDYTGNNPDKYASDLRTAREAVRLIEATLKADGTIARTPHEELERVLDGLYPNARSKEIVEHEGQRYQRRFTPLERSRSRKTVTAWDRSWVKVGSDEA